MAVINSPNMNLPVPVVGDEAGPDYATDVNNSLNLIDAHTHAPGSGVLITPDAIDINGPLSFNSNAALAMSSLTLVPQSMAPGINTIYESGVDLFYVDGVGNNIQITANGGVAGAPGSIANLVPPASASYVSGSSTFVWQAGTSTAANMDFGAATFRNLSPNSTFGLTLRAPPGLAANYTETLPLPPVSTGFMTMDSTGAMAATIPTSGGITGSNIGSATITSANIASGTITGSNIAAATITGSNIALNTVSIDNLTSDALQWKSATFGTPRLTFTVSSASATAGATYTNNGQTFTVVNTIVSQTSIVMSSTGAPSATGTLTKASGTGDTTITFSASTGAIESWTVPVNVNQVFVTMVGGGGGGAGGGTTGGGANPRGGGGGGEGSGGQIIPYLVPVTAGETLDVIVGVGGRLGPINTNAGSGGASSVRRGVNTLLSIPGGAAGSVTNPGGGAGGGTGGGAISSGVGNPGTAAYNTGVGGGGGGVALNTGGAGGSLIGSSTSGGTGGVGGGGTRGGGGGGGASGFANGGNGGNLGGAGAVAGTLGSGGGGGNADTAGAVGGNGQVIIYWLGHA